MYNTLQLEFLTPTINLSFGNNKDFYFFLFYLEKYIRFGQLAFSPKNETHPNFKNAPIGILSCKECPDIEIHFIHYLSFDEAKEKWERRAKRVNWNKIFVLIDASNKYEHEMIPFYLNLQYKMTIFTDLNSSINNVVHMKYFDKYGTDIHHPLLKMYKFDGTRGYDEYDFVTEIFCANYNKK